MQLFKHIDKDHSGYLSVFELKDALALGNLHLSMQTIQALMRLFKQGDRLEIQLDREEFERLHNFMKEIVEVFNLFDSEGNGKLTKTAANAALENINYQLSSNALDALYQSCDPDQNNELTLNEWISMNVILRGCQAVFRYLKMKTSYQVTLV